MHNIVYLVFSWCYQNHWVYAMTSSMAETVVSWSDAGTNREISVSAVVIIRISVFAFAAAPNILLANPGWFFIASSATIILLLPLLITVFTPSSLCRWLENVNSFGRSWSDMVNDREDIALWEGANEIISMSIPSSAALSKIWWITYWFGKIK